MRRMPTSRTAASRSPLSMSSPGGGSWASPTPTATGGRSRSCPTTRRTRTSLGGMVVDIARKLELFSEHWSPKVVARLNDYEIKLVKVKGEFVWHTPVSYTHLRAHE